MKKNLSKFLDYSAIGVGIIAIIVLVVSIISSLIK